MTIYAIGDIHGHLDLLDAAHEQVAADRAREGTREAPLIHLGDLVDRGPDSAGVVARLARLVADDPRVTVLKGNHDAMFLDFLDTVPSRWGSRYLEAGVGGLATLRSYGVEPTGRPARWHSALTEAVPAGDRAFLAGLPLMHRAGACVFVHAGIRPGVPLDAQAEEDLLWIRDTFLYDATDHGAVIVHGHTPVAQVELHANRLALDTGAAYGGPLSAVAIEGREVFVLTDAGRVLVRRVA
jgi:serine/threonine protein phosphatase 1